ncbi:MAG: hypothetical protein HZB12_01750 [Candidatus Yonathbacteria bacterium]|nr:hypothetical protein [Candidatus Yonathbacteria bacterium]
MKKTHTIKFGITLALGLFFAHTASAASLFFVPGTSEFGVGSKITVDLKIDSEGVGLNAAQATLRFPKETLEVASVEKTNSAFNFWLEDPTYSNENGVISFVGGTPYGISGASIEILRITFTSKGSGTAPITIVDAAITASDGSGTNILSKTNDAVLTVSTTAAATALPAPKQITREATPASGLPGKPTITIPLYGDPTAWSNLSNIFTANWDLPSDISGVNTSINKVPNFVPSEESAGLFDNKTFSALSDGVSYLHVRFKNSIGWGQTAHYRIAIDTQPPLPFQITTNESEVSDNPAPTFIFKTSDALSGVSEYRARAGAGNWIIIPAKDFKGSFALPIDNPGKYRIIMQAVDRAGNSIENMIDHETTAIASPTFTFVTAKLFSEEAQGLSIKGTAIPSTQILLTLKQGDATIASSTLPVDMQGNWEYTFSDPLRNGTYAVSIQNIDMRGAHSLVVNSPDIQVTGKYTNTILISFVVLAGMIVAGTWYYRKRREQVDLRLDVAESDASKVFKMIENDIEKLNNARETETPADDDFAIQKMKDDVKKMGGYVKEEISKAKK